MAPVDYRIAVKRASGRYVGRGTVCFPEAGGRISKLYRGLGRSVMNNIRREEAVIYNQGSEIPLVIERNSRAKRIRLKINRSGRAVLILPVRASRRAGLLFAGSKSDWIADQLRRSVRLKQHFR